MTVCTVSHWTATEWTDEMEDIARNKFVPMIMGVGASRVQMIRTGDLTFCVVTEYADEATASAAQDRITAIRGQATEELPMQMDSSHSGAVFASG